MTVLNGAQRRSCKIPKNISCGIAISNV